MLFINGYHIRTGLGMKGCLSEAQSEIVSEFGSDNSTLSAKDFSVGTSTMKAKYPGQMERSVFCF